MDERTLAQAKEALARVADMPAEDYEARRAALHPDLLIGKLDMLTEEEYLRQRARQEAKAMLAETTYVPPQPLDWEKALTLDEGTWLVPEIIGRSTVNLLVAKSTIGKTFLSISLICCGALGLSWAGRALSPFKTLIYLSEGRQNYGRRFAAWAKANNQDLDEIRQHVRIFGDIHLTTPRYRDDVRRAVDEFGPDLVVFDTFSGTSGVSDENDAAVVGGVLEATRKASDPASVLFIHHPDKASEANSRINTRGSGTLRNNVDTVIVMYDSDKRNVPANSPHTFVTLSTSPAHGGKVKDAMPTTISGFYLESVELGVTPSGAPVSSAVMRWTGTSRQLTKADRLVLEHLTDTAPMSTAEYMSAAGVSKSTAYRQLDNSPYALKLEEGMWIRVVPESIDEAMLSMFLEDDDTTEEADTDA